MRKQYLSTILGNKRRFGETVFPYDEILARSNKKNIYVAASQPCHGEKRSKTYNSGDSLVVTHLTTNPPVSCLYMAERTGSLILKILWSYVLILLAQSTYIPLFLFNDIVTSTASTAQLFDEVYTLFFPCLSLIRPSPYPALGPFNCRGSLSS
jgi:hypothetical protein